MRERESPRKCRPFPHVAGLEGVVEAGAGLPARNAARGLCLTPKGPREGEGGSPPSGVGRASSGVSPARSNRSDSQVGARRIRACEGSTRLERFLPCPWSVPCRDLGTAWVFHQHRFQHLVKLRSVKLTREVDIKSARALGLQFLRPVAKLLWCLKETDL